MAQPAHPMMNSTVSSVAPKWPGPITLHYSVAESLCEVTSGTTTYVRMLRVPKQEIHGFQVSVPCNTVLKFQITNYKFEF